MNEEKTAAQAELLFNRLSKRYRHLKKWARRTGTNSFRLYDRDIPEIPLVLDLYDDAVSGALYKRPYQKNDAASAAGDSASEHTEIWLTAMRASIARACGISENRIFLKERQRMRGRQETGIQYNKISEQHVYRDVKEGDLAFRVNLSDHLDTGLFLDARKKRALIREEAAGKRVLNLFAYTATLSVSAVKGGARQVDSVDLSNTYLEWGKINFALNKMKADFVEQDVFFHHGAHTSPALVRGDVLQFIAQAAMKSFRWDLILLDPPSFSNSKKMKSTLDIKRDYRSLIQKCLSLLSPEGTLYFSSNAKGFGPESADWPGFTAEDITNDLTDEDFKGKKVPLCYSLKKRLIPMTGELC